LFVTVAVFSVIVAVLFAIVAVKSETQAVLVVADILISSFETIISGSNMIIFASKTIKSGREAIWFEPDMIIFVPAIVFCALDMSIFGRKKTSSRPNTINLLPEKMIVMTEPIVSVVLPFTLGRSDSIAILLLVKDADDIHVLTLRRDECPPLTERP